MREADFFADCGSPGNFNGRETVTGDTLRQYRAIRDWRTRSRLFRDPSQKSLPVAQLQARIFVSSNEKIDSASCDSHHRNYAVMP